MTGPEHYRRAEELAPEADRLLGQGDGQTTAGVWAAVPRPMRCWLWPPPPPSAHPAWMTALGLTPPGLGSDPAAVIIDALLLVRA
jgi:hypothetical protein